MTNEFNGNGLLRSVNGKRLNGMKENWVIANNQIDLFSNNNVEKGLLLEYSGDKNVTKLSQDDVSRALLWRKLTDNHPALIEYEDILVTNMTESGSDPENYLLFAPVEIYKQRKNIRSSIGATSDEFYLNTSITIERDCLLKEIQWIYQPVQKKHGALLSNGNVVYLRIVKMEDGAEFEFINKRYADEIDKNKCDGMVRGAYMITTFEKKASVTKLRICGSPSRKDFLKAMEYYSLWDVSTRAKRLLRESPCENGLRYGTDLLNKAGEQEIIPILEENGNP